MWYVNNQETDPYLNLALEAYLLRERTEDFFYLWKNRSSVVCGKHQNVWEEVNTAYCEANNIRIARRLSGGGTVYHDTENLNFTFILNREREDRLIDFRACMEPIRQSLIQLGIPAEFSARNDLFVNGFKVSGNAEHVDIRRKRVLHHGTLLFRADLDKLRKAIRPELSFQSRSVKSVRSPVCNLADYLPSEMSVVDFEQHIRESLMKALHIEQVWNPEAGVWGEVRKLSESQYATEDWIFGYSPKFSFERNAGQYNAYAEVHQGKLVKVELNPMLPELIPLMEQLPGTKYGPTHLNNFLTLHGIKPEVKALLMQLFI